MKIKNWEIEGFKSISAPIVVEVQEGITLFAGENGSGKTSIIEALRWGLFGVDSQSSKKEDLVTRTLNRHSAFQGTKVSVEFEVAGINYQIHRCIDYKGQVAGVTGGDSLLLVVNEKLSDLRLIKDVQTAIIQIIGITSEVFELLVAIPQYGTSFMTLSNAERVSLLNTLFDFKWVDEAKERAKLSLNKINTSIGDAETSQLALMHTLEVLCVKQASQEQKELMFENNKASILADIDSNISGYQVKLKQCLEQKENWEASIRNHEFDEQLYKSDCEAERGLSQRISLLIPVISKAQQSIESLNAKIVFNEGILDKPFTLKDKCNACGSPLSADVIAELRMENETYIETIKTKVEGLLQEKKELLDKLSNDKAVLEVMKDERTALMSKISVHEQLKADLNALKKLPYSDETATWLTTEITKLESKRDETENTYYQKEDFTQEINVTQDKIKSVVEKIKSLDVEKDQVGYWVSKGFSDKGLKAFLTKRVLESIDNILVQYSNIIGWGVEVTMVDAASKALQVNVFDSYNVSVPFKTLSGGERRRVELAITFALHEVLTSLTTDINIMFLDEPFHHLDEDGASKVMELIRAKKKSMYITSHTSLDLVGVKVVELTKNKYTELK